MHIIVRLPTQRLFVYCNHRYGKYRESSSVILHIDYPIGYGFYSATVIKYTLAEIYHNKRPLVYKVVTYNTVLIPVREIVKPKTLGMKLIPAQLSV